MFFSRQTKTKGLSRMNVFESYVWLRIILLKSGDIEINPGPSLNSSKSFADITDMQTRYFSVVHYNVQSALPKLDILTAELSKFDVICLSETWFTKNINPSDASIPGYQTPFRYDRPHDNHGGVAVYIKDSIPCSRRNDLELETVECVWIELHLKSKRLLIGTFYRPPNASPIIYNLIENSIGKAIDTGIENILVTGDFNYDMLSPIPSRKVMQICRQYNMSQIISDPTHYTESSQSLLDIMLLSNPENVILNGVGEPFLDQNTRYHCPIFCLLDIRTTKSYCFKRKIWKFNEGNYDKIKSDLVATDWESLFENNVDMSVKNFTNHLTNLCTSNIPNKHVTIRQSEPPWIHNSLRRLMRRRKRAYDKAKRSNSPNDWNAYKKLRNETISGLRKSKQSYSEKLANDLKSDSLKSSDWWKTLKSFISQKQSSTIPPLKHNDNYTYGDDEKAEILNCFFVSQTCLNDKDKEPPHFINDGSLPCLENIVITTEEVKDTLSNLPVGKACGPDGVNNHVLKECATELSFPLSVLFNMSIKSKTFPTIWKEANVTPIFKKDDPSNPSNYRPISLLSTVGKVMEKIIFKHVFNYLRDHNILSPLQSGFIPGDSTVNQLVDIYNTFCKAIDDGLEVRAVFCDISKAFDRVWHKGLIYKLKSIGIDGRLLAWFSNYLSERKQRVVLPRGNSDWKVIHAGVPQGSILGPLLFLVYINDITENIHSNIRLFADDTTLYIIIENPAISATILDADLHTISSWADKWLVSFNPAKTKSLLISRKTTSTHPDLHMCTHTISEVQMHKHLGLTLDSKCTWHDHIENILDKAWKRINIMRKLKYVLDRVSLEKIYIAFIRPLLEYADVIWDNCAQYEVVELEKAQHEAGRIVTGATRLISIDKLYSEIGWETLSSRRKFHKLVLFYKMTHGLTPDYLSNLIPDTVGSLSRYNLRNENDIRTIPCRTQLYFNSFLPSTIRDWNELDTEIRSSPSLNIFKSRLMKKTKIPKYYIDGNRFEQVQLTRIRTNCSALKDDLFQKDIVESPLCSCGQVENSFHFFFQCPNFTHLRRSFLKDVSNLCAPTLQNILYGNQFLTDSASTKLLSTVHKFILNSKRFDT